MIFLRSILTQMVIGRNSSTPMCKVFCVFNTATVLYIVTNLASICGWCV